MRGTVKVYGYEKNARLVARTLDSDPVFARDDRICIKCVDAFYLHGCIFDVAVRNANATGCGPCASCGQECDARTSELCAKCYKRTRNERVRARLGDNHACAGCGSTKSSHWSKDGLCAVCTMHRSLQRKKARIDGPSSSAA